MSEFNKRIAGPMMIPLAAAAFIAVLVFALSRILLAVPELGSNSIAFLISAEILGIAGVIASTAKIRPAQKAVLFLTGLAIIGGGAAAGSIGVREIEHHGDEIAIVAKDIAFDLAVLNFPADETVTLTFENADANVPHNVGIYADEAFTEPVFIGEVFNGIATLNYEIEPLTTGSYPFRCDVHPTQMVGVVEVGGEGGEAHAPGSPAVEGSDDHGAAPEEDHGDTGDAMTGEESQPPVSEEDDGHTASGAGDETDVIADGLAFDVDAFTLSANAPVVIHFQNLDEDILHNVAIYTDDTAAEKVYGGELITGVDHAEYRFDSPAAGDYFFRCDVHPDMQGTATFA